MGTVDIKMTAIADEIREISGETELLGLDAMAQGAQNANSEIALQVELLSQATEALKGKASVEGYEKGVAKGFQDALDKRTELTVTANGEYDPKGESTGFNKVNVNVTFENKLAKVADRSITELTANDLYGVTTIGTYAFGYCNKLNSVEFPETLISIGNNAFNGCYLLRSIEIPTSLSSLGDDAFSGCSAIASEVVINGNVKIVGNNAFYNCQKIPSIVLHEGIEKIGNSAFQVCYALKEVYIPNSVREIGMQAFRSCKAIEKVTIGNGITKINANAFTDNTELKSVTIKATTPPSIQSTTFQNVPSDCAFYVPSASVEAYKSATNWSARADYIFPIEEV